MDVKSTTTKTPETVRNVVYRKTLKISQTNSIRKIIKSPKRIENDHKEEKMSVLGPFMKHDRYQLVQLIITYKTIQKPNISIDSRLIDVS